MSQVHEPEGWVHCTLRYAHERVGWMCPTLCSCPRNVFRVQLHKNNARALLSRILSIVKSDWLQHMHSVLGAGLEFPHGHGGHCLPFFKFGYDALRPMSTFSVFFTTSWPWCLFVTLPNGLSAPNFQNLKFEAWLGVYEYTFKDRMLKAIKIALYY